MAASSHTCAGMLRRFRRDRAGTSAVEFGLLIVPFMLTLLGTFEVGYTFFMVSALDSAARGSARAVMTGAVSTAGMGASTFRTSVVCPKLPKNFTCSDVFVNVTVVPTGSSPTGYYSYVNTAKSALLVPALNATANSFCPGSGSNTWWCRSSTHGLLHASLRRANRDALQRQAGQRSDVDGHVPGRAL